MQFALKMLMIKNTERFFLTDKLNNWHSFKKIYVKSPIGKKSPIALLFAGTQGDYYEAYKIWC